MNGGKPTDGGILYDETETDEDDDIEVAPSRPVIDIDWSEGLKDPGLKGAELIQEFVKRLPNSPASIACSTRPATVLYVGRQRRALKSA